MTRHWIFASGLLAFCVACGDDSSVTGASSQGGTGPGNGGSTAQNGGNGGEGGDVSSAGGSGQGTTTTNSTTNTSTSDTTTTTSTGMTDPYEEYRIRCMTKINELRASKNLSAYGRWTSAETCADQQATSDQAANKPHGAFGMCGENGQNECLGHGPDGIESCLQQMWDERLQPDCQGCDACADAYNPNCPNCDFFGSQNGQVCGHYVNMSAKYFSEAACGFSTQGGWDVINFH